MPVTRRDFARLAAGTGALAALGQLGRAASAAAPATGYRAMVAIFLFGGNDGWNMVVPSDARHADYAAHRGAALALPQDKLLPLTGTGYGLNPAMAPLIPVWDEGALSAVLNTGSLYTPLTKTLYTTRPDLRPVNLFSHADEQNHWQGNVVRGPNLNGFMGRMLDQTGASGSLPPVMSFAGSSLAMIGKISSPLILGSSGALGREGYTPNPTDAPTKAREAALAAFADASRDGELTDLTAKAITTGYEQAVVAGGVLGATTATVDAFFKNPATGKPLTSDLARQLNRVARMIEARGTLGHARQTFFTSSGGFDTHTDEVERQAGLLSDLAMALAAFHAATKALGVQNDVTTFTMSEFGRTYAGNAQRGADHAWGSNHLVMGGALAPRTVHGTYPELAFGGPDDAATNGRWIPSIATEEYVGSVVGWSGLPAADLPYVFPNWSTWSTGGRGPVRLFG